MRVRNITVDKNFKILTNYKTNLEKEAKLREYCFFKVMKFQIVKHKSSVSVFKG